MRTLLACTDAPVRFDIVSRRVLCHPAILCFPSNRAWYRVAFSFYASWCGGRLARRRRTGRPLAAFTRPWIPCGKFRISSKDEAGCVIFQSMEEDQQ
jgi:hypothetical protein